MPLYEYQCDACGCRFELIRKFSDPPLEACPTCGGAVRKLMSSPAIQFKGSGFYITDYPKAGQTQSGKSDSDSKEGAKDSKEGAAKDSKEGSSKKEATETSKSTSGSDSSSSSSGSSSGSSSPAAAAPSPASKKDS